jgi:hypothetical protein
MMEAFRLRVPVELAHRAQWVFSNAQFTEEELAFIATGRLSPDAPGDSEK